MLGPMAEECSAGIFPRCMQAGSRGETRDWKTGRDIFYVNGAWQVATSLETNISVPVYRP